MLEQEKIGLEQEVQSMGSAVPQQETTIVDFEKAFKEVALSLADYEQEMPKPRELLLQLIGGEIVIRKIKKAS